MQTLSLLNITFWIPIFQKDHPQSILVLACNQTEINLDKLFSFKNLLSISKKMIKYVVQEEEVKWLSDSFFIF